MGCWAGRANPCRCTWRRWSSGCDYELACWAPRRRRWTKREPLWPSGRASGNEGERLKSARATCEGDEQQDDVGEGEVKVLKGVQTATGALGES